MMLQVLLVLVLLPAAAVVVVLQLHVNPHRGLVVGMLTRPAANASGPVVAARGRGGRGGCIPVPVVRLKRGGGTSPSREAVGVAAAAAAVAVAIGALLARLVRCAGGEGENRLLAALVVEKNTTVHSRLVVVGNVGLA